MQMMFDVYRQTGRLAQARTTMEKMMELYDKPGFQEELDKLDAVDRK